MIKNTKYKLNTSNLGKYQEFKEIFAKYGIELEATHHDLREIDADLVSVIAHKASQLEENTLVDDTSLEVEGESIGVNVRWFLDHLKDYAGRKAKCAVLLAYHKENTVFIFKGSISGIIVESRGNNGFGFDAVFLPDGTDKTLAESKPGPFNAREKAIEALIKGDVWAKHPLITCWDGPWQNSF